MIAYCENMTTTFHTVFYLVFVKKLENLLLSIDNHMFRLNNKTHGFLFWRGG